MPMVRAMRMLNAIEAGTTSGAQLQTLLADAGRLGEWQQLLVLRGQTRRIAASSTAMTAVAASSTAMTAVAASSTAMAAVVASSAAMAAVVASSAAMAAVAASSAAMAAVAASSAAMAAVVASSTAMAAVAASSTAMTAVAASSTAMTAVNANDQAVRIWMLAGTNQIWSNFASVTAVAASSTAMTAVAASSTARLAVFNSDTALSAISASASAKATIRAAAGYTVVSKSNSTSPISLGFTGNVIMVGFSSDNTNGNTTIAGRRAGSTVGLLSITAGQTPVNTTATFDNVMALTSAATTLNSWSTSTHYFGVLPV